MTNRYHIRQSVLPDGRNLSLYSWSPFAAKTVRAPDALPPTLAQLAPGQMIWHPLEQDFVCVAPHRQNRTFKPDAANCPLCPTLPNASQPTEIPVAHFNLAVFDNRFPSYVLPEQAIPLTDPNLRPAHGKCEVIVYSPDHDQSMGTLSDQQRLLLIEAWVHRYDTLLGLPDIEYVQIFENRGDAAGVTLPHPHGQIYGLPFVPQNQQRIAHSFQRDPAIVVKSLNATPHLILAEDDELVAFCPDFGKFSYEIWITTKTPRAGLWDYRAAERQALSRLLGQVASAYDQLFDTTMPYIMALQAAPPKFEKHYHSYISFQPLLRAPHKLKYIAGVELATGHYLKDVTAHDAVTALKPFFSSAQV
jgi:UDPglucose--hexose-1-phosphate uridylyltransferase